MFYKPVNLENMGIDKWLRFYDQIPIDDKRKPITTEILNLYMLNTYMATQTKRHDLEYIFWNKEKYVEFCLQWM